MTSPLRLLPLVLLAAGCSSNTATPDAGFGGGAKATKTDPWPTAANELRRSPDLGTAKRVLAQLNADLAGNPDAEQPTEFPPAPFKATVELLRLSPDEAAEVSGKAYTGLDAAHLAESLYLRDVVRSLDLGGLPPNRQARVIFDWVCRQVYLQHWFLTPTKDTVAPCMPPTFVLRRGYGTGLERAYVLLALFHQAGFDAVLVGKPGKEQATSNPVAGGQLTKGPFWAVAARAGNDLFAFDPWRSVPLPGANGGVATLAQVKANPDLLKVWFEDKATPWDVTREDVTSSVAYVTAPLSAVTPRIKLLEAKLAAEVGVKLAADPERVAKELGCPVWAPPVQADGQCYTRVLASFLPKDDGGFDRTPAGPARFFDRLTVVEPLPVGLFVPPADLDPGSPAVTMLRAGFLDQYKRALVDPAPREKIHRGQFNEVIGFLVQQDQTNQSFQERSRADPAQAALVREWCKGANQAYQALGRARLPENRDRLPEAQAAVDAFWRDSVRGQQAVLEQAAATSGLAEASYLLAVAKHEQAERAGVRLLRAADAGRERATADAKRAWASASDAWERYAPYAAVQEKAFPGRAASANALTARAKAKAADPATN